MSVWNYSNWITQTDPAERLRLLRLHIAEVSDRTVAIEGRSSNVTQVDAKYLQRLMDQEESLKAEAGESGGTAFASNPIEFLRR